MSEDCREITFLTLYMDKEKNKLSNYLQISILKTKR